MVQVCARCQHVNPAEAVFCFFDGNLLRHVAGQVTPTAARQFPSAFVFPSGLACRDFDELARGCQKHWADAVGLLQRGVLEAFLGSMGRADLAMAAREAANFPDSDRGLDQLLGRLPTSALTPPQLHVEPVQVNLGPMSVGHDARFELRLDNRGSRLLYGSVVADANWLTIGEGAQKLFQCTTAATVSVTVRGQQLRAGNVPMEGKILVESNGGSATVLVRVTVPIKPFAIGVLAGSVTPRQIAEKALKSPREAAVLFENGAVARWYQSNGWTYPVQGPSSLGLAVVQQFFEALGLTRPPKIEIGEAAICLHGRPGETIRHDLELRTGESRAVYAHGVSDQPWLKVGQPILQGARASLPLEIAAVPPQSGTTLQAVVRVTANGNQRFNVPVALVVGPAVAVGPVPPVAPARPAPEMPRPYAGDGKTLPARRDQPVGARKSRWSHLAPLALLFLALAGVVIKDVLSEGPPPVQVAVGDEPETVPAKKIAAPEEFKVSFEDEPEERTSEVTTPAVVFQVQDEVEEKPLPPQPVKVEIKDDTPPDDAPAVAPAKIDPNPRVRYAYERPSMRFGLVGNSGRFGFKKLTYSTDGGSNSTVVRIDGQAVQFGSLPGRWLAQGQVLPNDARREARDRTQSTWSAGGIDVNQILEIVPSKQPVLVKGVPRRFFDTLLVRYQIINKSARARRAGLRIQVDTMIGSNDGVPFTVPGQSGLVNTFADFLGRNIPDFIQALEIPDLQNPGTVAHMTVYLGNAMELPDRVSLTRWPGFNFIPWEVPIQNIGGDSAIVLYWDEKPIPAGARREFGFAYGLGNVTASDGAGKLGVTLGGSFEPGQDFTVTAYVQGAQVGQTVTLELPDGLERVAGTATQAVPRPAVAKQASIITWKVKVLRTGEFPLLVKSNTGASQKKTISIARPDGPTGGKMALQLAGSFEPEKVFDLKARVTDPVANQTLRLTIPEGLERVEGGSTEKVPAAGADGAAMVAWKLKVLSPGKHAIRVASSTGAVHTKTLSIIQPSALAGQFHINLSGDFVPGKTFAVKAMVPDPVPGQRLTLVLPPQLQRVDGDEQMTAPPPAATTPLIWKVKVLQAGKFLVRVRSSTGNSQGKYLTIGQVDPNAGKFRIDFAGTIQPGKDFAVLARVTNPVKGQKLTLSLAKGPELLEGASAQAVPALAAGTRQGDVEVRWQVRIVERGRLRVRVESSTGIAQAKTITISGTDPGTSIFGN